MSSGAAAATQDAETDPTAVISMVLGALSILLSWFVGTPAVTLGHLSKAAIRRSNGRLKGDGMALAGLILWLYQRVLIAAVCRGRFCRGSQRVSD